MKKFKNWVETNDGRRFAPGEFLYKGDKYIGQLALAFFKEPNQIGIHLPNGDAMTRLSYNDLEYDQSYHCYDAVRHHERFVNIQDPK